MANQMASEESKQGLSPIIIAVIVIVAILILLPCCIIVILALLGPAIGNVFSNILEDLEANSGAIAISIAMIYLPPRLKACLPL